MSRNLVVRRAVLVVAMAAALTGFVDWRDSAPDSPLYLTAVLAALAAALGLGAYLARRADVGHTERSVAPSPRAWAEIPRPQRARLIFITAMNALLFVLIAPLTVLLLLRGAVVPAIPSLLLLALMTAATVFVWRRVRRPSEALLNLESKRATRPTGALGRLGRVALIVLAYPVTVVVIAVALAVHHELADQSRFLAIVAALGVNLATLTVYFAVWDGVAAFVRPRRAAA